MAEIRFDSRLVRPGDMFVALPGTVTDGHRFIPQALEAGAVAVVCETLPEAPAERKTWIVVPDAYQALGRMASGYYGHPSQSLHVVGITGTNGKTTIATLLYRLLEDMGYPCGLLSTVTYAVHGREYSATHTTPDPLRINRLMAEMVEAGTGHCFMEVSSHAIAQQRIEGLHFAGGVFTNLTHDHLDYHGDFKQYLQVKKSWFDRLPDSAFALVNLDDKHGKIMLQNCAARHRGYSLRGLGDYNARILESTIHGLVLDLDGREFHTPLTGRFNASNLLAVYGTACELGFSPDEILPVLSKLKGAPGRFETYVSPAGEITGIVDYAHTPDALKNVLHAINEVRKGKEQLITVIGCGGDRDKAKRPLMARVACELSERVILTSDNPRSEPPEAILADMKQGLEARHLKKCLTIPDRREAIDTAVGLAEPGDIILLAGKGHETYQEIAGERIPFSDKETLLESFKNRER